MTSIEQYYYRPSSIGGDYGWPIPRQALPSLYQAYNSQKDFEEATVRGEVERKALRDAWDSLSPYYRHLLSDFPAIVARRRWQISIVDEIDGSAVQVDGWPFPRVKMPSLYRSYKSQREFEEATLRGEIDQQALGDTWNDLCSFRRGHLSDQPDINAKCSSQASPVPNINTQDRGHSSLIDGGEHLIRSPAVSQLSQQSTVLHPIASMFANTARQLQQHNKVRAAQVKVTSNAMSMPLEVHQDLNAGMDAGAAQDDDHDHEDAEDLERKRRRDRVSVIFDSSSKKGKFENSEIDDDGVPNTPRKDSTFAP